MATQSTRQKENLEISELKINIESLTFREKFIQDQLDNTLVENFFQSKYLTTRLAEIKAKILAAETRLISLM